MVLHGAAKPPSNTTSLKLRFRYAVAKSPKLHLNTTIAQHGAAKPPSFTYFTGPKRIHTTTHFIPYSTPRYYDPVAQQTIQHITLHVKTTVFITHSALDQPYLEVTTRRNEDTEILQ